MSRTEKLKNAIEKQAASLDPAQREFVMAELRTYIWNDNRMEELEEQLQGGIVDPESGIHDLDREGKLFRQRHQIVSEQSALFSHIMRWLKGTAAEKSPLDEFLAG